MEEWEKKALIYLPDRLSVTVMRSVSLWNCSLNEIRIRKGRPLCLQLGRKIVKTDMLCSREDVAETVSKLCQGSLYSYAEGIKEGVILAENGIRAGVCGRAVVRDGRIDCVRDITSVNIRIPHRIKGAADKLYTIVRECGSTIVYSRPGMGKTTALRELIPLLAGTLSDGNVSVIDTRFELSAGITEDEMTDVFLGYPRMEGIMSAVRTMAPRYIICDEIADSDDAKAILSANSAGVCVVASAHASSYNELTKNPSIKLLIDSRVFGAAYGIVENGYEVTMLNDSLDS